jgi:hypothetical protein
MILSLRERKWNVDTCMQRIRNDVLEGGEARLRVVAKDALENRSRFDLLIAITSTLSRMGDLD